jgi:hypothetical protein
MLAMTAVPTMIAMTMLTVTTILGQDDANDRDDGGEDAGGVRC